MVLKGDLMSDFIFPIETNVGSYHTTEHYLRRVLVGDRESVRNRLIAAMERLGYDILDDEESVVRGRRQARGWASAYSSADVLDYPMTLIVKLKPQGEHATRATFDYVVKHPSLTKGEKEILSREAEAISALATVRAIDKICSACGTESTDDSRFCRRCGTKMSVESNELEILRMSSEIRAGYTSVVSTFVVSLAGFGATAAALIWMLLTGAFVEGIGTLVVIGLVLNFLSLIFVGFGWNRVKRSLNRPKAQDEVNPEPTPPLLFPLGSQTPTPVSSVTERTTNLLSIDHDPGKTGEFPN